MKRIVLIPVAVLVLLAVLVAGLVFALQDPNRFRPQIETLIRQATGMQVTLDGDLSWQLWPPVVLEGQDIRFEDETATWAAASVGVQADLLQVLSAGRLEVRQLRVDGLVITDRRDGARTWIDSVRLTDFAVGRPGTLHVEGRLENAEGPATDVTLDGLLTLQPDTDSLQLDKAEFRFDGVRGTCDVAASGLGAEPRIRTAPTPDDLLPLDTFRAMAWEATCVLPQLMAGTTTLHDVAVKASNRDARSRNHIEVPDMLGGRVSLDVDIDTRQPTPVWTVRTDADELQSQQLMDVLAPSLKWAAPLLADGELTLQGNTLPALMQSVRGELAFDASAGLIDITTIRQSVLALAELAGKAEKVSAWPEQLAYESLKGNWQVAGTLQHIAVTLDNVTIDTTGPVDLLTGELDLRSRLTINRHPTLDLLPIGDAWYGLPVPMRCTGTLEAPDCGLDTQAAKQTVADLARGKVRDKVDAKLDALLEDKVPEGQRESARKALKSLGGLLQGRNKGEAGSQPEE